MKNDLIPRYEGVICASYTFPEGYTSSDVPTNEYLHINECGYTVTLKNDCDCQRPARTDFEIFYTLNGNSTFYFNQKKYIVTPGQIVFIKPGEFHYFIHHAEPKAKVYWIHFTGTGASDLLKSLDLWNNHIYTVGLKPEIENYFSQIFQEIRTDKLNYQQMCAGIFMQLLTCVSRYAKINNDKSSYNQFEQLNPAFESMYSNLHSEYQNHDYAKMCNMSTSYFITLFKQKTSMSPLAFKQNIRMERAKSLLTTTNLTIKEIAQIVGYADPLYFYRIFHKKNGIAPGEFRKKYKHSLKEYLPEK